MSSTQTPAAPIRLTQYSHGAGCGCKIAPAVLSEILAKAGAAVPHDKLLVGNDKRDDAAVFDLDGQTALISTTDFFMPIVDDPETFGGIASVNAISDVYAMGGRPVMAIAILGWPIDKLPADVAGDVLAGAREACKRAGIPLAGGHSIDAPEPIFGLAVTGTAPVNQIKANATAEEGCELFLTKPIGIGILTTAQKKGILQEKDLDTVTSLMLRLNNIGAELSKLDGLKAMTDVTGFGLLGHLVEMCEGSGLSAEIRFEDVPLIEGIDPYLEAKTFPGGMKRNFASYGHGIGEITELQKAILCDPQTSGGLLCAVEPGSREEFLALCRSHGMELQSFGKMVARGTHLVEVK